MYSAKCPKCGEKITGSKRKCRSCGTELVICSECGTASYKGTETCNMCGRVLVRQKRREKNKRHAIADGSAPNDLVSVINYIKQENVFYKVVKVIKSILCIAVCISAIIAVAFGLMFSGSLQNTALAVAEGCSVAAIGERLIGTVPRNIELWRGINDGMTFETAVRFFNYLLFALMPAAVVIALAFSLLFIPLDIIETVICGIAARKRGYNEIDTVAVLECPSLIYKSEDSFDKAYVCFPFLQRISGRFASVATETIFYLSNLLYCGMTILSVIFLEIVGIVLRLMYLDTVLAAVAMLVVIVDMLVVLAISLFVCVLIRVFRSRQLKKWSDMF